MFEKILHDIVSEITVAMRLIRRCLLQCISVCSLLNFAQEHYW
jgi:hypothetical protein